MMDSMQSPVVHFQDIRVRELFQRFQVAILLAGGLLSIRESGQREIAGFEVFQTGFMCQCTGDIIFANSGGI